MSRRLLGRMFGAEATAGCRRSGFGWITTQSSHVNGPHMVLS